MFTTFFIRKPEGKRLLGRPSSKWEDNVTIHLREIQWEVVDLIRMTQDRDQ
jgi:hypothetical protein